MAGKNCILLLSNDKDSSKEIKEFLINANFNTLVSFNPFDALNKCVRNNIELFILDINNNKSFGLEVIIKLKEIKNDIPIIVLSNRNDVETKIIAFNNGANDFISKPFNNFEFKARILNQLKTIKNTSKGILKNGDLTIDFDKRLVTVCNHDVELTAIEYKIICLLADNINKVLTYDYIIEKIWGKNGQDYNGLRVFMSGIRDKLKTNKKVNKFIRTQVRVGYRMKLFRNSNNLN